MSSLAARGAGCGRGVEARIGDSSTSSRTAGKMRARAGEDEVMLREEVRETESTVTAVTGRRP
jgi:hypothetical protein